MDLLISMSPDGSSIVNVLSKSVNWSVLAAAAATGGVGSGGGRVGLSLSWDLLSPDSCFDICRVNGRFAGGRRRRVTV